MLVHVLRRLWSTFTVAVGVAAVIFVLLHLSGDPVALLVPADAPPEVMQDTRRALGLDRPLPQQFFIYLSRAAAGDLGTSLRHNLPVAAALALAIAIAIPAGIVSALRRGTLVDRLAMVLAVAGQAVPIFWLALMLIWLFAVRLEWLPVFGSGTLLHLVLPAVSLSTIVLGRLARLVRSSMLEVLEQDYVRTARAKGLGETSVVWRHALKNASIPIVTVVGLQLAQLLGGAVVTETIFAWPGVGVLAAEAVFNRDFPVVQGVTLVISLIFVATNLAVDLAYVALNPRIRLG
jgi:ABC-type dipeptide/oligopeptide/nickel transport system permease component